MKQTLYLTNLCMNKTLTENCSIALEHNKYICNFIWNKTEMLRFKLLLKVKPFWNMSWIPSFWRIWAHTRFQFFVRNHNIAIQKNTKFGTFTKCRKWIIDALLYLIDISFVWFPFSKCINSFVCYYRLRYVSKLSRQLVFKIQYKQIKWS